MGLGALDNVTLADARQMAADARKLLASGIDPIEARKASRAAAAAANTKPSMTFDACCEAYIAAHQSGWKNAKHGAQWSSTLTTYASPVFATTPVREIDTAAVLRVLEPIWSGKAETASRVRGRIERILDWAKVRGYREGENPAQWRGHLDQLLPRSSKVKRVKHHPALPYAELPAFLMRLREQNGVAARTLEFVILTAARTGEAIGAKVGEINCQDKVWTIPAERMKAEREHRVPLTERALALLDEVKPLRGSRAHLFPGLHGGLSNIAMLKLLERMKRDDLTVHGFRSTFRDWAAERTSFPNEVVEMALAHTIGDKVEAAYRRGDLFDKRRRLMDAWAEYCEHGQAAGDVVALRA
jgi:integrase